MTPGYSVAACIFILPSAKSVSPLHPLHLLLLSHSASSGTALHCCWTSCMPSGALAKLFFGKLLSRSVRAGSLPRSASCAGSARAGRSSQCTCSKSQAPQEALTLPSSGESAACKEINLHLHYYNS